MSADPLFEIFLTEADELVADLENGLVALEEKPEDREIINSVFRAAHTLKGSAGLVGVEKIVELTHLMESIFERLREGKLQAEKSLISNVLRGVDILKGLVESVSRDKNIGPVDGFDEMLKSLRRWALGKAPEVELPQPVAVEKSPVASKQPLHIYQISLRFNQKMDQGIQDPYDYIEELSEFGYVLKVEVDDVDLPPFAEMDVFRLYIHWRIYLKTDQPQSRIENVFLFVMDDNPIRIKDVTDTFEEGVDTALAQLPLGEILVEDGVVSTEDISRALSRQKRTGELLVEEGKVSQERIREALDRQKNARQVKRNTVIRVETEKLDKLVNLVGELVTGIAHIHELVNHPESELEQKLLSVKNLDQISRDLQETVMMVRMVPVEDTFVRFKRLVRDTAAELGKKVRLEMNGTETELDKNVIEQLADPLKHLVRNCLDHGLESPEQRRAAGKDETGTVTLSAAQREGNIFVEVSDDGQGINTDRIMQKAIEKGLVSPGEQLSRNQIFQLIFEPGFSTANEVTDISGRGVGMDVVQRNIQELRGNIEILSEKGKGTTFRIKLPLTLAIIDGMNVRVGGEVLTIPLLSIVEQVRPLPSDIKTVEGKGELVDVRGQYLPMVRLHRLFDFTPGTEDPSKSLVVVLENEGRKYCVLVDDVLGQQQAVIKSLDRNFQKVNGVAGATILGDGRVSLILDVHGMEQLAFY